MLFQGRLKGVSREISVGSRVFERSSKKFQGSFKGISRKFQGYLKIVSRVFQGRLKVVSMEL